jgi:hypothetical protein
MQYNGLQVEYVEVRGLTSYYYTVHITGRTYDAQLIMNFRNVSLKPSDKIQYRL